jgi:hypothetical protein
MAGVRVLLLESVHFIRKYSKYLDVMMTIHTEFDLIALVRREDEAVISVRNEILNCHFHFTDRVFLFILSVESHVSSQIADVVVSVAVHLILAVHAVKHLQGSFCKKPQTRSRFGFYKTLKVTSIATSHLLVDLA